MYGRELDDPIMREHMEDVAEESRHLPKLECDECGHEIEDGEIYYDIDGYLYCEKCMDKYRKTRS